MSTPSLPNACYLNALVLTVGHSRLRPLLSEFHTAMHAWESIYTQPSLLKDKARQSFETRAAQIDPELEWKKIEQRNITVLTLDDKEYPPQLRTIHSPPLLLYVKGDVRTLSLPSIAVVGTRSHSSYGKEVVERIIPHITRAGICIVSGLAQGIDTLAHSEALKSGGITVAVLGCGLDVIETSSSKNLVQKIYKSKGAIISEYPLSTPPLKHHFPARNRIIAGLTLGTLVVESRLPGGSLITAQHALDEGRDVFAVPGPITGAASEGTNKLIQEGAYAVTSADDILDILNVDVQTSNRVSAPVELSQTESMIMEALEMEALYIDEIVAKTDLAVNEANARLTALELKGLVKNVGGNTYQRTR